MNTNFLQVHMDGQFELQLGNAFKMSAIIVIVNYIEVFYKQKNAHSEKLLFKTFIAFVWSFYLYMVVCLHYVKKMCDFSSVCIYIICVCVHK